MSKAKESKNNVCDPVPMNPCKNSREFLRKGAIVRITDKIILMILYKFERIATPVPGQKPNPEKIKNLFCYS